MLKDIHDLSSFKLHQPSLFFHAMILGAQGVFYNLFFFASGSSPKTCHRFVGHLEEEAVVTYTHCIQEMEAGRVPEWSDMPAPQIAIDYWRLPSDSKMLDVICSVRSDETTHRFVNHSYNTDADVNPFAMREPDMHVKEKQVEFKRRKDMYKSRMISWYSGERR
ncbi:AOX-domain-containing protein [Armillaria gallica]|uniref:Alternative oxidase n=1 Tax=Armillaria gallica TaxID=47427 RepID=A0A2H3E3V1_ARMGA|nr:AOX-domain-containing protein [Armillaria gallica]